MKLNPNDPSTQVYDPNAALGDRTHMLNNFWDRVEYIVQVAQVGLSTATYENHEDSRKLAYSFFGIKQAARNSPNNSPEPSLNTIDGQKLRKARCKSRRGYNGTVLAAEFD